MFNYAAVIFALLLLTLVGWRITHSEAPYVQVNKSQRDIRPRISTEPLDEYGDQDGGWAAESAVSYAGGALRYVDNTDMNPEEEDYRKRIWIGGEIKIRSAPYYAKQVWPRTWRAVDITFPAPPELILKTQAGEWRGSVRKIVAEVTFRAEGMDNLWLATGSRREELSDVYFARLNATGKTNTQTWNVIDRMRNRLHHLRTRDLSRLSGSRIGFRGNEARDIIDWLALVPAGEAISITVYYKNWGERQGFARSYLELPAPPDAVWAAFPEAGIERPSTEQEAP